MFPFLTALALAQPAAPSTTPPAASTPPAAPSTASPLPAPDQTPTRDGAVPFAERPGYVERPGSGLTGPASFLWIPDRNGFDAVFELSAAAVNRPAKPTPLPDNLFATDGVVAVIRRGPSAVKFAPEYVGLAGGTLTVRYAASDSGKNVPGATFASPMILSVPRDRVREVVFVENGAVVGKVAAKGPQK